MRKPSLGSGSWFDYASDTRAAKRFYVAAGYRDSILGFRLVKTVP
jgi:formylglycine-generating enzyme required for sulfatase activity